MNTFNLNGKSLNIHQLLSDKIDRSLHTELEFDTILFIKDWLSEKNEFSLQTSGSTGEPKTIRFSRKQIQKSAQRTIKFFNLKAGNRLLTCLNPKVVAGMMMIVRAFEGDLQLSIVTPSSNPLAGLSKDKKINFVALTPHQIEHAINDSPEKLDNIKTILIGGAGLHQELERRLQKIHPEVFHSYAMTETLTHVALRKVNDDKKSTYFHALDGVSFSLDNRSCLVIDDKILGIESLATTDIAQLIDEKTFVWKGRYDNVINSGGVKINIEKVETEIRGALEELKLEYEICVIAQPDIKLTNKLILLLKTSNDEFSVDNILNVLKQNLPKYHAPRHIALVREIIRTKSGKIDRISNTEMYLHNNKI